LKGTESVKETKKSGLGIIFHSGSYDRLVHGMSIALAALALGRKVKFLFTYWALEYVRRDGTPNLESKVDKEGDPAHIHAIHESIKRGHLESISELIPRTKELGAELYTCTNSMSLLNITPDELMDEIDQPIGLVTFLDKTLEDQILFI
jgi:peroxiredoxin family protein